MQSKLNQIIVYADTIWNEQQVNDENATKNDTKHHLTNASIFV